MFFVSCIHEVIPWPRHSGRGLICKWAVSHGNRSLSLVGKGKGRILIERYLHSKSPSPAALLQSRKWWLLGKSQWCCSANCGHPLHALTDNWTRGMQLANTPLPQSTTPGLHAISIHQMALPVRGSKHPITAYYTVYLHRKDERLSRPGWLVTYRNKVQPPGVKPGHVTHPSTNRARRRVTSLIRPTPLPLRHAAKPGGPDTIRYRGFTCTKIWRDGQLNLAHGTETKKIRKN